MIVSAVRMINHNEHWNRYIIGKKALENAEYPNVLLDEGFHVSEDMSMSHIIELW